jgi:hypothetical protein
VHELLLEAPALIGDAPAATGKSANAAAPSAKPRLIRTACRRADLIDSDGIASDMSLKCRFVAGSTEA